MPKRVKAEEAEAKMVRKIEAKAKGRRPPRMSQAEVDYILDQARSHIKKTYCDLTKKVTKDWDERADTIHELILAGKVKFPQRLLATTGGWLFNCANGQVSIVIDVDRLELPKALAAKYARQKQLVFYIERVAKELYAEVRDDVQLNRYQYGAEKLEEIRAIGVEYFLLRAEEYMENPPPPENSNCKNIYL